MRFNFQNFKLNRVKFLVGISPENYDKETYPLMVGYCGGYSGDEPKWVYGECLKIIDDGITEPVAIVKLDGTYRGKKEIIVFPKILTDARFE